MESEWMNLREFEDKIWFVLRDLEVKVKRFEGKVCEWIDRCDILKKSFINNY